MSDMLQMLGRGLIRNLADFFSDDIPWPSQNDTIEQLNRQLQKDPEVPDLHLQIGLLYLRQMSFQQAIKYLNWALHLKPDYRPARLALILAYAQLSNDDHAIEQLHSALQVHGPDPQLCFVLAFCHERAGDVNAAVHQYRRVLELDQAYSAARYRLAAIALHQGRFEDTAEQYEIILTDDPGSVFLLTSLGNLYLRIGQPTLAMESFQRALLIEPDNWQAADQIADELEQAGLYPEAIKHVTALIEEQPGFADLHLRLAGLYAKAGHDEFAVEQFHRALQIHPNFLEAVVRLGAHHLRMERSIEAARCFARAVEINDNLLVAYVGLGVAQMRLQQDDLAERSFAMAASIEPNTTLLFAEMARLYLKCALNTQLLRTPTQNPDNLAWLLAKANPAADEQANKKKIDNYLLEKQIDAHAEYLANHPNYADLHYRHGLLLIARDRLDQAIEQFRQALAINPSYLKAKIKLALALRRKSESVQALALLKDVFCVDLKSLELHYRLGLMYSEHSTFAMAVEQYQNTLDHSDQAVDLQANISLALQNMRLIDPVAVSLSTMQQITPTSTIPASGIKW